MLKSQVKHITIPKIGNEDEENEDMYEIAEPASISTDNILNFSIADGATESYKSRLWASLICKELNGCSLEKSNLLEQINLLSKTWYKNIDIEKVPWYSMPKLQRGAHSTLLKVQIDLSTQRLNYFAIGDTCLFHVRDNRLANSIPVKSSHVFSTNPVLVSSNPNANASVIDNVCEGEIPLNNDDFIILCTDAMAQWFLSSVERREAPWLTLQVLFSTDYYGSDFNEWLNEKRGSNEIKDDDTTVILIYI